MDFGVASFKHGADALKLTMTGAVLGTPTYMSPEQATGKPTDARSDLYSLGVTLCQMLTGHAPFETESAAALLLAHVKTPVPRLATLAPGRAFSEPLQGLIDALLHKDPERRPQSAAEALKRVEALLRSEPSHAEEVRVQPAAAVAVPAAVAARPVPSSKTLLSTHVGMRRIAERGRPYLWPLLGLAVPLLAFFMYWLAVLRVDGSTTTSTLAATNPRPRDPAEYAPSYEPPRRPAKLTGDELAAPEPLRAPAQVEPVEPVQPLHKAEQQPEEQALVVLVRSSPVQARVFQGERDLGKTPYSLQITSPTRVTLKLAGYAPYDLDLTPASKSDLTVKLVPLAAAVPAPAAGMYTMQPTPRYLPPAPNPLQVLQAMPRNGRKQSMVLSGPPFTNVALAKRAYQRGAIDETLYDDIIWALRVRRKDRLAVEKANYRNGMFTRDEYDRRVRQIDYNYEGE
jgi:hypothetical protein